jgi:Rps23 Pro-64 3,4-dihydroxylase Tpa1-like proline 4-hydroxylase
LINPQLPVAELKNRFARDGRIVIDDVLDPAAAEALYQCLLRDVPWEIVFRRGAQVITLTQRDLERLPQRELDQLMAGVQRQAQTEFQFVYWKFSMVDAYRRQLMPQLLTHRLLESLCAAHTLELIRQITGFADIQRVDAQATLYRPGNFLTEHTDDHDDAFVRRAAYVIQLCKDWKADWGGLHDRAAIPSRCIAWPAALRRAHTGCTAVVPAGCLPPPCSSSAFCQRARRARPLGGKLEAAGFSGAAPVAAAPGP